MNRSMMRFICAAAAGLVLLAPLSGRAQVSMLTGKTLLEGLNTPRGVAIHPVTREIYFTEEGNGRIQVLRNGRAEPALAEGWRINQGSLPNWAISERVTRDQWLANTLQKPGSIAFATNGTLYVSEQIPDGRILEFRQDANGQYSEAFCVPVPWLDQEFQWKDIFVDNIGRLYIAGADEVGSEFMKFGSVLMRDPQTENWLVIDFGPFADFYAFALSDRQDVMLVGDRKQGDLSWWEVDRRILLGGAPNATGRAQLLNVAIYPDGTFLMGQQDAPGRASLVRVDPFSMQQTTVMDNLRSIGDIAINREDGSYVLTDPEAGRLVECTPNPPLRFNEIALRQIVRSVEGMSGVATEAPAFLNTFMDRLQDVAKDILDTSTHGVQFNFSDIAGKMPVIAGRVRAAVEIEGVEDDPIDTIEFFLLFPSKVVLTDTAVSPSLSFFSATRRSGKIEQTRRVFDGDVGVYRLSGTNVAKIATSKGGVHVPVVSCGMESSDHGLTVNLSFLGSGIYGDYYLTLFQGPRDQSAKLIVKSPVTATGRVVYEASFMDEQLVAVGDTVSREKISNFLVAGFQGVGVGASRAMGWLNIGQFPAQYTVGFGDTMAGSQTLGAPDELKAAIERTRMEMSLEAGDDVELFDEDELSPAPAPAAADDEAAPESSAQEEQQPATADETAETAP